MPNDTIRRALAAVDSERWHRLKELFHGALDRPPAERAAFLAAECAGDDGLRLEVARLVEAHERANVFLSGSALDHATRSSLDHAALVGRTLGAYEVLAHLGTGGMGEVYLARSTALERKVALKLLPPRLTRDEAGLHRFIQEGKLTSALNHPNIITIHEIGHADGLHFLVTEFVEGTTLRERLDDGPLPVATAVDIAVQVSAALAAAHSAGVIHRDIKPENLMLRPDGYVKVLDFGLAKLAAGPPPASAVDAPSHGGASPVATMAGALMGTARYMSPEQARGLDVDQRADFFSLGAVLYEMLAGRPAFEGETPNEALRAIRDKEPAPLAERCPDVPKELDAIVRKALRKDRDSRHASASELVDELRSVQRTLEHGRGDRTRTTVLAAAAAVAALVGALVVYDVASTAPASEGPAIPKLAVLPFINLKPDAETDFLSYSLAETVSTRLGPIRTLTVTPGSAVYQYRNQAVDPTAVARDMKADLVLTGNYLKEGDVVRISAQLMEVGTSQAIFQDEFSVQSDRLLTLHDTVARRLISALNLTLSAEELETLRRDIPHNSAAWELYLRGIDHLEGARLPLALDALEKSVSLDPEFSWGWTELGAAYIVNAAVRFGGREMYTKAQAAFDRAIALSPTDPRPRIMYSDMLIETNRVEDAVPILRGIVRDNPRHASAIWQLGYAYRYAGMLEESAQAGQAAYDVDPGFTPRSTVFNTWLYLGQYARFRDSVPQREGSAYTRFYQGFAEYHLGNMTAAARAFDDAYALDPEMLQARVGKALRDVEAGRRDDALRLLHDTARQLEQRGLNDAEGVYKVAQAFAVAGDQRAAMRWFAASVDGGFFCYPYFTTDPLLENVRPLPEFQTVLDAARRRHDAFRRRFF